MSKIKDEITSRRALGSSNGHRPTPAVSNGHSPGRFIPYRARTKPKLPFNLAGLKEAIRQSVLDGDDEGELIEILKRWNSTRPSGKRWTTDKCQRLIGKIAFETFYERHGGEFDETDKKHPYEADEFERPGSTATWGKSDAEVGHYFMVNNGLVDSELPIPATVWRVWASLLRHANYPAKGRVVRKVTQELLEEQCYLQRRTVRKALDYLDAIHAIKILFKGGSPYRRARRSSVYLVPSLKDLDLTTLLATIRAIPWRGFTPKTRVCHPQITPGTEGKNAGVTGGTTGAKTSPL